jgi:NTE family protein
MSEPTIGLALGGGGARGLAHIHVIEALDELGIKPKAISGTSVGALIGSGMASGMTGADIREYVLGIFDNPTEVASRFWKMRPGSISEVWNGPRTLIGNIDSKRAMRAFLPEQVKDNFSQLDIDFQVVATDFYGQTEVVISEGNVSDAIAASIALPAVFRPVKYKGAALVDGGVLNALPFELLFDKVDIVVAVDVVGGPMPSKGEDPSRIEAVSGASQLMMQAATRLKCELRPPDVMIVPPVNGIAVLDFMRASSIIEKTASTRETTKQKITAALEAFQKA